MVTRFSAKFTNEAIADGTYAGITETGVLGETVAFGEPVYFKAGDSRWWLAKAIGTATSGAVKIGICVVGGEAAATGTILLYGKIRADSLFPEMTISAPMYLDAANFGRIVVAAPTGTTNFVVRIIGFAKTADELLWCPDNTYVELA